jgi:hypothetical protein
MAFNEHRFSFAGKKVRDFTGEAFPDLGEFAIRVKLEYDEGKTWAEKLQALLELPNSSDLTVLVIGAWDDEGVFDSGSEPVVEALVAARDQLPNLNAIFLGDITYEECEVSWIHQSDLSPIFNAYPKLEFFAVRGGEGISLGQFKSQHLKNLVIQTGGLDVSVVREVLNADLPNLEHLELYLGTDNYGANTQIDDLAPLLRGELFPKLNYLGLRNSDLSDALAGVLVNAPILERIKTLDLSLGTLSDEGAKVFSSTEKLGSLEKLDLHYHYVSEEVLAELKSHLRKLKIKIDASDAQDPNDEWRSTQTGE